MGTVTDLGVCAKAGGNSKNAAKIVRASFMLSIVTAGLRFPALVHSS
jgi:hypothetical protein